MPHGAEHPTASSTATRAAARTGVGASAGLRVAPVRARFVTVAVPPAFPAPDFAGVVEAGVVEEELRVAPALRWFPLIVLSELDSDLWSDIRSAP